MKGFDDKALLLFPKMESYEHRSAAYKYQFRTAVNNLLAYLNQIGMTPHAFYTDDVARALNIPDVQWVNTLCFQDMFFAAKHCTGMSDYMDIDMITHNDICTQIANKEPLKVDMSEMDKFTLINKHNTKAVAKIIPTYKVVIHFVVPGNAAYKVTSKPNDGKIRITISANTFIPKTLISGVEENPCNLLGMNYANRALDSWEVIKCNQT